MSTFPLPAIGHSPSLHVPWSLGLRVSENYPRILYLFTRSDLKTILLPVVSTYIKSLIPCLLICGRPSLPFSCHLAQPLIACCYPCFGHGYTYFNFVSQIRVWTLMKTHQTNHGGLSLQASYLLMLHVICAGCCCPCVFPFQ